MKAITTAQLDPTVVSCPPLPIVPQRRSHWRRSLRQDMHRQSIVQHMCKDTSAAIRTPSPPACKSTAARAHFHKPIPKVVQERARTWRKQHKATEKTGKSCSENVMVIRRQNADNTTNETRHKETRGGAPIVEQKFSMHGEGKRRWDCDTCGSHAHCMFMCAGRALALHMVGIHRPHFKGSALAWALWAPKADASHGVRCGSP
jgi:hypothetical protein